MKSYEGIDIDVRNAVTVGETKQIVAFEIFLYQAYAPPGLSRLPCLRERHLPLLSRGAVQRHASRVTEAQSDIRGKESIVKKILFDEPALVTETEHEVVNTVMRVKLHDVPEHRVFTDPDQRLRDVVGNISDARARAPTEYDRFQLMLPRVRVVPAATDRVRHSRSLPSTGDSEV